jgi:single-strand DNA-binding protein
MSNPNITIVGRIASEPESKTLPSGGTVSRFRVITNDRRKNSFGEWEDRDTSGWTVVCWDRLAENVLGQLSKGEQVIVNGVIKEISWQDSTGNKKYSFEVKAQHIGKDLLMSKPLVNANSADISAEW